MCFFVFFFLNFQTFDSAEEKRSCVVTALSFFIVIMDGCCLHSHEYKSAMLIILIKYVNKYV